MSDDVFYDTDCLSCFISIDDVSILKRLFKKIFIPYDVYREFSRVYILKERIDQLVSEGSIEVVDFDIDSKTYEFFTELRNGKLTGRIIGNGEAAAIALAVENNGILASNNTKDVIEAVNIYSITRIRTGDILVKAFNLGIITRKEGDEIWKKMIVQKRFLTEKSFSKYLKKHPHNKF